MMFLLTENLSIIAGAPNGVRRLRELVLQLAITGKLVPQDRGDEPASKLLKRAEIERSKKGRAEKGPYRACPGIEFEVPAGWEWAWLWELGENIQYGYTASAEHSAKDICMLRITDIQKDRVNWEKVPGCEITSEQFADYALANGDIVIARTGGTIGKSYLVENVERKAVFASYLIRIKKLDCTYPQYLKVFLGSRTYWNQLMAKSMGTGQPNVSGTSLKGLAVPVPPLAEQHRIVAKVDELMKLCDQLESQQKDCEVAHKMLVRTFLDALVRANDEQRIRSSWRAMSDNFDCLFDTEASIVSLKKSLTDLAVNGRLFRDGEGSHTRDNGANRSKSSEWRSIKFADVCVSSFYGPRFGKDDYVNDGVPTIRTTDMTEDGRIVLSDATPKIKLPDGKIEQYGVLRGDLLITRTGSIGTMAVFDSDYLAIPSAYLIRFRLSKEILPEYAYLVLTSAEGQRQLGQSTTTMAQPNINAESIKQIRLLLPPIDEQRKILDRLRSLFAVIDKLKESLTASQRLKDRFAAEVVSRAGTPADEKGVLVAI